MTGLAARPHKKKSQRLPAPGQVCFGLFAVFCLLLLLRNADIAMEYIHQGLLLCARMVIPALFPFMILSEILLGGGLIHWIPQRLLHPLEKLLDLPRAGCCAVILGMLCGAPVGARCACLSYDRGELTREEAQRVLPCANHPSSAFLINAVGVSLWESRRFGWALYTLVLLSALLLCLLGNRYRKRKTPRTAQGSESMDSPRGLQGAKLFTESIASATRSILTVCAYVIFFSALMGALTVVLHSVSLPAPLYTLLFCLLEISGGVGQAAGLDSPFLGGVITAFACGWSGLSMHCQVLSICDGRGFSFRPYLLTKLAQGLLCAALFGLVLLLFPELSLAADPVGF
ncbi:MAG: hypothetical protein IJX28_00460 [Clostridia bacterium]|nr:hypothetical protein [Clostridia bacterium]